MRINPTVFSEKAPSSAPRGWYCRGYLPHRDHPGLLQSITYRLADSLPSSVLHAIEAELSSLPSERQDRALRQRVDDWLDAGHGSCLLRRPEAAACVVDTWRRFAGERYDLIAWVVMPNHVHVLVRVYENMDLGRIVQSWKSFTGRRIAPLTDDRKSRDGAQRSQAGDGGIWMREYWDRYIRDELHFDAILAYIHQNPVKARLVVEPEAWPWSSAAEWKALSPQP